MKPPRVPHSEEIAGWFVGGRSAEVEEQIRTGALTAREAKRLAKWVTKWARWVTYLERKVKRER